MRRHGRSSPSRFRRSSPPNPPPAVQRTEDSAGRAAGPLRTVASPSQFEIGVEEDDLRTTRSLLQIPTRQLFVAPAWLPGGTDVLSLAQAATVLLSGHSEQKRTLVSAVRRDGPLNRVPARRRQADGQPGCSGGLSPAVIRPLLSSRCADRRSESTTDARHTSCSATRSSSPNISAFAVPPLNSACNRRR